MWGEEMMQSEAQRGSGPMGAVTARDLAARQLGQIVAGRYQLLSIQGTGGAGIVYRARHLGLQQTVALKVLYPHLTSGDLVARFIREGRCAAALEHPGIVNVFDLGQTETGSPYLAMELLEGMSLTKLVKAGTLRVEDTVAILHDVLEAIAYAHAAGIVHRDLKPGNIFLVFPPVQSRIKILDFGMAKVLSPDGPELTRAGQVLGTPGFMSPEQVRNSRGVDPRTDVYAAGAMLFFTLVGRPPVEGKNTLDILGRLLKGAVDQHPAYFRPDVPDWLDALVARALAPSPDDRIQSAREFADGLRHA